MTEKELSEKLHEIARAGVDDFNAGKANLAEIRERAAAVFAASEARLDFVMKTQRRMAQSLGQLAAQTPGVLKAFPAWRLIRRGTRHVPRDDWDRRWIAAGAETGWQGACREDYVALKDSPIWAALGQGAGGFRDAIGNPFPPFAFGSGMGWVAVARDEAKELGLIEEADNG